MGENAFFKNHCVNSNQTSLENGIDYTFIQIKKPFPFKAWGMGVVTFWSLLFFVLAFFQIFKPCSSYIDHIYFLVIIYLVIEMITDYCRETLYITYRYITYV